MCSSKKIFLHWFIYQIKTENNLFIYTHYIANVILNVYVIKQAYNTKHCFIVILMVLMLL